MISYCRHCAGCTVHLADGSCVWRNDPNTPHRSSQTHELTAGVSAPTPAPDRPAETTAARTVAALYVQPNGAYASAANVDMWPEHRDARLYEGPHPVVAHPPCQLWGSMAEVNYKRWGGEHNRPGNDGGCFAAALAAVNRWHGVLEHPAKSRAWAAHGLDKPAAAGWKRSGDGWVCEVWQSAYGHRANKATWLYYVGDDEPFGLRWDRPAGTHQIGFHDQRGKMANKPTLGRREANATPVAFRDELLRLARHAVCGATAARTVTVPVPVTVPVHDGRIMCRVDADMCPLLALGAPYPYCRESGASLLRQCGADKVERVYPHRGCWVKRFHRGA